MQTKVFQFSPVVLVGCCSRQVLQTGQEITELDSSGFSTQSPTVYAGNMAGGECIVQVCVCVC